MKSEAKTPVLLDHLFAIKPAYNFASSIYPSFAAAPAEKEPQSPFISVTKALMNKGSTKS